tara:strand:+ start:808 stop:912 length:105 start_codon:yes stop_codon:yes gene_type:complete
MKDIIDYRNGEGSLQLNTAMEGKVYFLSPCPNLT